MLTGTLLQYGIEIRETLSYAIWYNPLEELKQYCFKQNISFQVTQKSRRLFRETAYLTFKLPYAGLRGDLLVYLKQLKHKYE